MTRNYLLPLLFCLAVAGGYFMPANVAAQAPAVLFGMSNGVPQPIKSTGGALWVTVTGGSVTTDTITASDSDGIAFQAYEPDVNGAAFTPTLAGAGAGNLTNGIYSYKFTVSTVDGETAAGTATPNVTVVDKTVNGKITVKIPMFYNAIQVTKFSLYRTVAGGSVYKLVDDTTGGIFFGDATYTDNIADASLGATIPSTNTTLGTKYTINDDSITPGLSDNYGGYFASFANPTTDHPWGLLGHDALTPTANAGGFSVVAGNSVGGNGATVSLQAGFSLTGAGGEMRLGSGGGPSVALAGDIILNGARDINAYAARNMTLSAATQMDLTTGVAPKIRLTTTSADFASTYVISWLDGAIGAGSADVGLTRESIGVLKVTNGSSGRGVMDASEYRIDNVPLGTWTTPGFSAGNFTGGGGTWTVAAGDVKTYEYVTTGYVMTVNFQIYTSTIGGTTNAISIAIPNSKVSTHETEAQIGVIDGSGTVVGARAIVSASGTTIQIKLNTDANFATSTDTTYVLGQITFQIN